MLQQLWQLPYSVKLILSYTSKASAAKLAWNMDKTSATKHIRNNLPQCAASTGYKEKYVGQMVHTKFHGLQTDNHLYWKNGINQFSKCAYNAHVHLLMWLIFMYVPIFWCNLGHSHLHLTISRSALCNISQQVPFHPPPSVTVPKTQHNTYFYTSPLYGRCVIHHNVSAGLQKLTFADLQYILRTASSVMHLKQVKCPRF